ncbi:MAG: hypothetical protein KC478_08730 [Bacteriovoracaceae bacterium]|nr:hypothetical protein [Bacteriovoracaceae bacterium]
MILNQKGSSLMYTMFIIVAVGIGFKVYTDKFAATVKSAVPASKKLNYETLVKSLSGQLFDPVICSKALNGATFDPTGVSRVSGLDLKISGQTLGAGSSFSDVRIEEFNILLKENLNRDVFLLNSTEPHLAYEALVYVIPANLSDAYSMDSQTFKDKYAIPLTIYTDTSSKIRTCFGKGSHADLCTRRGGAYNVSQTVLNNIRCQPDLNCIQSQQGIVASAGACLSPYTAKQISPTSFLCMWCNEQRHPAPAAAPPTTPTLPSPGGGGGGGGGNTTPRPRANY